MNIAVITQPSMSGQFWIGCIVAILFVFFFIKRKQVHIEMHAKQYAPRKLQVKEVSHLPRDGSIIIVDINEYGQPIAQLVDDKEGTQFILLGYAGTIVTGQTYSVRSLYLRLVG